MPVSLLLMGLTTLLWTLGARNSDEVIGILEKVLAVVLLVLTLCVGGLHLLIGFGLLALAFTLPKARTNQAPMPPSDRNEIFLPL
jgi:hypothetical protein